MKILSNAEGTNEASKSQHPPPHHHQKPSNRNIKEDENESSSPPNCCLTAGHCVAACQARHVVCPYVAHVASQQATLALRELQRDSTFFAGPTSTSSSSVYEEDVLFLDWNDLEIHEKLGQGGFAVVHRCYILHNNDAHSKDVVKEENNEEDPSTSTSLSSSGSEISSFSDDDSNNFTSTPLAVKYLKHETLLHANSFRNGAVDLVFEAQFLGRLRFHPHVVRLHGLARGFANGNDVTFSAKEEENGSMFLVIDRLEETLDQRIKTWKSNPALQRRSLLPRRLPGFLRHNKATTSPPDEKQQRQEALAERLGIADGIASAMEYLHDHHIVYRDLKPTNIGFDRNGVVKIFDFGIAREIKQEHGMKAETYEMTGDAGSLRYMAPEVAKKSQHNMYNKLVDVYSFGILLWEICAAEKPFAQYSVDDIMYHVVWRDERPKMRQFHHWPEELKQLMSRCWSVSPDDRPSFTDVRQSLQAIQTNL
mmetsp:Transcript_10365/g.21021  ORF Transcript_10365/g.21021 Transcript_10365/m.21021 type:complete len:480 (+) Transcript_10365:179-1618(+)